MASLPDAELVTVVGGELQGLLGISGEPLFVKIFRYIGASPQPLIGHSDRVARIQARLQSVRGST